MIIKYHAEVCTLTQCAIPFCATSKILGLRCSHYLMRVLVIDNNFIDTILRLDTQHILPTRAYGNLTSSMDPLQCPICTAQYDDKMNSPVTLPCGHSCCLHHPVSEELRFCMTCRREVPPISQLVTSYALLDFSVAEKKRREKGEGVVVKSTSMTVDTGFAKVGGHQTTTNSIYTSDSSNGRAVKSSRREIPKVYCANSQDTSLTASPGSSVTKIWRVRNIGDSPWPADTQLVYVAGRRLQFTADTSQCAGLASQAEADLTVHIDGFTAGGTSSMVLRLFSMATPGQFKGESFSVTIMVSGEAPEEDAETRRANKRVENVMRAKSMSRESLHDLLRECCTKVGVAASAIQSERLSDEIERIRSSHQRIMQHTAKSSPLCLLENYFVLCAFDAANVLDSTKYSVQHSLSSSYLTLAVPRSHTNLMESTLYWPVIDKFVDLRDPCTMSWRDECDVEDVALFRIILRSTIAKSSILRERNVGVQPEHLEIFWLMVTMLVQLMTCLASRQSGTAEFDDTSCQVMRGLFGQLLAMLSSGPRPRTRVWQLFDKNYEEHSRLVQEAGVRDEPTTTTPQISSSYTRMNLDIRDCDEDALLQTMIGLYPLTKWDQETLRDNLEKEIARRPHSSAARVTASRGLVVQSMSASVPFPPPPPSSSVSPSAASKSSFSHLPNFDSIASVYPDKLEREEAKTAVGP